MSYFKNFPTVEYDIQGTKVQMTNIFKRFSVRRDFFEDNNRFFTYEIKDGETPEMIADKIYDDPEMAFVILLANNIHNYFEEWPLSYSSLERYVNNKYGVSGKNDIKHYIDSEGKVVNQNHKSYDKFPVTNFEYEIQENDKKREIKLIVSSYIEQIKRDIREFSTL